MKIFRSRVLNQGVKLSDGKVYKADGYHLNVDDSDYDEMKSRGFVCLSDEPSFKREKEDERKKSYESKSESRVEEDSKEDDDAQKLKPKKKNKKSKKAKKE